MERLSSRLRPVLALGFGLAIAAPGAAQLLTPADPALAAAAGIQPGANLSVVVPSDVPAPAPEYGTATQSTSTFQGNMFRPRISTGAYTSGNGAGDILFASGDTFFDAQLDLPNGALWESASFWGVDSDAANDVAFFLFRSCQPPSGPGPQTNTILGSGSSTGAPGAYKIDVPLDTATQIDNTGCIYWVRARFDAVGLGVAKARVQWRRQVSPAPVLATFLDVPTGHPFFRFVEALASAGITGGCGGGNYCPDTPVTRGQMAVFLSIALGLHFPN
jgi:S-layer homology domain